MSHQHRLTPVGLWTPVPRIPLRWWPTALGRLDAKPWTRGGLRLGLWTPAPRISLRWWPTALGRLDAPPWACGGLRPSLRLRWFSSSGAREGTGAGGGVPHPGLIVRHPHRTRLPRCTAWTVCHPSTRPHSFHLLVPSSPQPL